jgi:two-component system sensor histidine kinase KdpD
MLGEGRLAVEIADGLPLADVDYLLVEQVVSNLLENAARYTPPGTAVTVRATPVPGGAEVELAVVDHGPGVAEEERERIFDQFYRLRAEGQGPVGTGMGLAIVKGIAEAHGGRIWVEATPGGGATFVLRLPVSPESMLPDDGEPAAAVAPPAKA